jgi:hypothetical protein
VIIIDQKEEKLSKKRIPTQITKEIQRSINSR